MTEQAIEFLWPSDADRAENDELNRVCEHLEYVIDDNDTFRSVLLKTYESLGAIRSVLGCPAGLEATAARDLRDSHQALAAHQACLVRELSACQAVLHSLAHDGEVSPDYASHAKKVLGRTNEASLARRDSIMKAEALEEVAGLAEKTGLNAHPGVLRGKAKKYRHQAEEGDQ